MGTVDHIPDMGNQTVLENRNDWANSWSFNSLSYIHTPIHIENCLHDRRENSGATRPTQCQEKGAIVLGDYSWGYRRQGAFPGSWVII